MKASDLFVKALENEGVEYIFGIPGEENLEFLESLRTSKIRLVLTRHEQAAGFMAAAHGRLTGRTGVCLSTLGPGATNFATSAAYAQLAGIPVLFITGQKPIKKSKQGRFQIVDIVRLMEPITKFSRQIVDGTAIPHLVREAFRTAEEEKPGSVHLELPEDVAAEAVARQPFPVTELSLPSASESSLHRAARLLTDAKRPLLCLAAGANRRDTHSTVLQFVNKTGLFFFSTQMGKGVVDERHPRFLGTTSLSDHDYVHRAIEQSDVILIIGHDLTEKPPFFMRPEGQTVIHLAFSMAGIDDVYFPHHEVIGCPAANTKALAECIEPSPHWDFAPYQRIRSAIERQVHGDRGDDDFPINPKRLVHEVRKAVNDDGILSLDNGMYKIWFARNYPAYGPNTVLLDNALASMGAGLPVAIGAKLLFPHRDVVAVCGDGGFMMNSQELETAVRYGLNLVVLLLRDDAYGMIRWKQAGMGFEDYGMTFGNPDFVRYAESYGARAKRVDGIDQIPSLLRECLDAGGVWLIDVPIDYVENQELQPEQLRAQTASVVTDPYPTPPSRA